MHHPTDRIVHTTAFVKPAVENWLEREYIYGCVCNMCMLKCFAQFGKLTQQSDIDSNMFVYFIMI